MLSSHDQQAWEEILRHYPDDAAEEPVALNATTRANGNRPTAGVAAVPVAAVVGLVLGVLLLLIGVYTGGLLLCAAVIGGLGLRFWWAEVRAAGPPD